MIQELKSNRWLMAVVLFLLALFVLIVVRGNSPLPTATTYHHRVIASELALDDGYEIRRRFSGRVSARQHADIGFEQGGKLAEILVDDGFRVGQGDVIATLDVELLKIERQELSAQYKETEAQLKLTDNNLQRQLSLKKSGYTSEQRLDELQTERSSLLAAMARLDASLESVASRIRKASLLAPFDGVITRRFVDQGAVVSAGVAVVRLQQEGVMEARIGVPVRMIDSLPLGETVEVTVAGVKYLSTLMTMGADVNPITKTVNMRLALPADANVINGDLAYLTFEEKVVIDGFWVPSTAVTDGVRGLWVVYVMEALADQPDSDVYRLVAKNIDVLHAESERLYVSGDLRAGDKIVAAGMLNVVPGQLVRTKIDESVVAPVAESTL